MGIISLVALALVIGFSIVVGVTAWSILAGSHGPVHRQTKVDREFHRIVRQLQ